MLLRCILFVVGESVSWNRYDVSFGMLWYCLISCIWSASMLWVDSLRGSSSRHFLEWVLFYLVSTIRGILLDSGWCCPRLLRLFRVYRLSDTTRSFVGGQFLNSSNFESLMLLWSLRLQWLVRMLVVARGKYFLCIPESKTRLCWSVSRFRTSVARSWRLLLQMEYQSLQSYCHVSCRKTCWDGFRIDSFVCAGLLVSQISEICCWER